LEDGALTQSALNDGPSREARLTKAVETHAGMRIELQDAGRRNAPFVPIAEMRFECEIDIDQEMLHFDPVEGRGFVPYGALTSIRRSVYPASVHGRPASRGERAQREHEGLVRRLTRYFSE
jgi:hypothetical protein